MIRASRGEYRSELFGVEVYSFPGSCNAYLGVVMAGLVNVRVNRDDVGTTVDFFLRFNRYRCVGVVLIPFLFMDRRRVTGR